MNTREGEPRPTPATYEILLQLLVSTTDGRSAQDVVHDALMWGMTVGARHREWAETELRIMHDRSIVDPGMGDQVWDTHLKAVDTFVRLHPHAGVS